MLNIRVNGKTIKSSAMVFKFGMMEKRTRDIGLTIWHMDKVSCSIKTGTYMRAIGSMIRLTAKVNMCIKMVLTTKVSGNMILSMEMPLKFYPIVPDSKEHSSKVSKTDLAHLPGWMVQNIQATSNIIKFMGRGYISGLTAKITKENGVIT